MSTGTVWTLIKQTLSEWSEDNVSRLAAALAYYAMFALAPLLVIAIAIVGFAWGGEAAAKGEVEKQIKGMVGEGSAQMLQTMIANAGQTGAGIVATIVSLVFLFIGATGVFVELQSALNLIWGVRTKAEGVWGQIRSRFLSFLMVLGIAFLLLATLIVSALISGLADMLNLGALTRFVNIAVSLGILTLLFAMMFKVLPDVEIQWKDVWVGALATAVLFTVGSYLIGLYLGRGSVGSVFGAAGSLVAILVWLYYSAQIMFTGAEFTQVYARWSGSHIRPNENAEPLAEAYRKQLDIPPSAAAPAAPAAGKPQLEPSPRPAIAPAVATYQAPAPPPSTDGRSSTSGKVVSILAGVAIGRLLLPKRAKAAQRKAKPRRHFAPSKILQPGWTSRASQNR